MPWTHRTEGDILETCSCMYNYRHVQNTDMQPICRRQGDGAAMDLVERRRASWRSWRPVMVRLVAGGLASLNVFPHRRRLLRLLNWGWKRDWKRDWKR